MITMISQKEARLIREDAEARLAHYLAERDTPDYKAGGWYASEVDRIIADTRETLDLTRWAS